MKCSYCGSEDRVQEWQQGWEGDAHGNPIRISMCDPCSRKYSGERRKDFPNQYSKKRKKRKR